MLQRAQAGAGRNQVGLGCLGFAGEGIGERDDLVGGHRLAGGDHREKVEPRLKGLLLRLGGGDGVILRGQIVFERLDRGPCLCLRRGKQRLAVDAHVTLEAERADADALAGADARQRAQIVKPGIRQVDLVAAGG